ncbi:hypothetical protein Q6D67_20835 [Haliea sp. E1-2-M8]|uniref:hypothetical protein n=1 Tax=Haliea sp. E1-2-M8 TaxID=3064706 RepID=UPI00271CF31B|nr:hypothetical protein [Haliea sp. E1-2-M8]MDO8864136.1 hypothetical protein [Haliea sp. E1-2-M8]
MRHAAAKNPSVRDGSPVLVTVERGAVSTIVEVDHQTILHNVHGSAWAVAPGVDDLADIVDDAAGAWRLLGSRA